MPRIGHAATIALLLFVALAQSWAANPRKWGTLTNCQYGRERTMMETAFV